VGGLCVLLALVLMLIPDGYREGLARGIRASLLRPVIAIQAASVERDARFDDPVRLRAERDSLAAFLVGQATLSLENRQLRELLELRERLPPSFIPAEVIRIPGRAAEGHFQLTAGTRQGIRPGMPVVGPSGLVGRVTTVEEDISFGIDWMNVEFRAAAMTLDGEVYGVVEPRRGSGGEPMLALTGTPRHVELDDGAVLVTSGHGGLYPRGIPLGTVVASERQEADWQRSYLVRPLVGPGEMTYVLVLGDPQEVSGRDLAAIWGIRAAPARVAADTAAILTGADGAPVGAQPQPQTPAPQPEVVQPRQPRLLGVPVQPQTPPQPAPDN
jgi:rod shape-determining protein MreC